MMRERFNAALKEAMLKQDKRRTATLRLVNAAIKDRDIAARTAGRDPVSDDEILEILGKMIKQRLESTRQYEEGNRLDLAEEELRSACAEAVKATGSQGLRDMGKCMAELKARYAGRLDFGKASQVVKEHLQ